MCECAFCRSSSTTDLPVYVRLTHPEKKFAFWVLVCNFDNLTIFKLENDNVSKSLNTFGHAVRNEYKRLGMSIPPHGEVDAFVKEIKSTDGTLKAYDDVAYELFSGKRPSPFPSRSIHQTLTCACRRDVVEMSAWVAPAVPRLNSREKPGNGSTQRSKRPKRTVHATAPGGSSSNGGAVVCHGFRERQIPPSSPLREDDLMEQSPTPYPEAELGGSTEEVQYILRARPEWDQEAVNELMRWGALPRLFKVGRTFQNHSKLDVECVFVQPSGRLTDTFKGKGQTILQPLFWIRRNYADQVSHLP